MSEKESTSEASPPVQSLHELRARIDSVDREIIALLARRNGYIGEVARYKREQQIGIRDIERERNILEDRRHRAGSLGVSGDLVESLFRLILWGSRDRQAALKAEVPLDVEPRTVAVIGGRGGMGHCVAELFGDLGHAIMIADVDTDLRPLDAAAVADVVVVSVPIEKTCDVIREIGPAVREDALLIDVTSVKTEPLSVMLDVCRGAVVGTHPLFAPSVHSLQGQRVVLCPGRGDAWLAWLKQNFGARGLVLMECTPESHDKAMAVVQVLTHFATEVTGRTLSELGVSVADTLQFTSPVYFMELLMTARHFAQSPDLYASIQMSNPDSQRVMASFVSSAQHLQQVVDRGDRESFAENFETVRSFFGSFTDEALERSSFLIDRLVERM